jgi:SAM-dependent methyltransferase
MNLESFLTIRHLRESPAEAIETLEGVNANELYRAALAVQNDLHVGANVRYLSGRAEWLAARLVLDLGCGPGDLIAHLSRQFSAKSYTGVDVNEDFVAIARDQTRGLDHCRIIHADLYDFAAGRYDFVILSAVLQHLKYPDRLMKHLPDLLCEGGTVLFLDTTRESFVDADPPIVAFDDFYNRLEPVQKEHTGSRDCMAELERQLAGTGFRLVESLARRTPVSGGGGRQKVVQYLILGCSIGARMMSQPLDLNALVADLLRWHDAEDSRLDLKSRLLLIARA